MRIRCGRSCARWIAVAVGCGSLAGAGVAVHQIYGTYAALRPLRWPLNVAAAALWIGLAVAAFAGARWQGSLFLVPVVVGVFEILGDYDNESFFVPLLAFAIIALLVAYSRSGDKLRALSGRRQVLLGLSLLFAGLAVVQMHVPKDTMNWDRVRTATGDVEVRPFVGAGRCAPPSARSSLLVDQGCDFVIPAERARLIIGYTGAAMVLGIAAVAGARRTSEPAI